MPFTNNAKLFTIIIFLICAVIYYYYYYCRVPIIAPVIKENIMENYDNISENKLPENIDYMLDTFDDNNSMAAKFVSKNSAVDGKYKQVDYKNGDRSGSGTWNKYFGDANSIIDNNIVNNENEFLARDETIQMDSYGESTLASYKQTGVVGCGSNQDCSNEDLFNADNLLPKQTNPDWFDVIDEPIPIKDRHLTNVYKPISINTIGTSKKNASHDLRGDAPCPKSIISPFNNSSIDPDTNIRAGLFV